MSGMKRSLAARRMRVIGMGAALALALGATGAAAEPYSFTFTGQRPTLRFLVADPVPTADVFEGYYFSTTATNATSGGTPASVQTLYFNNADIQDSNSSVSFGLGDGADAETFFNFLSPKGQLYTGSEGNPTFKTGTFFFAPASNGSSFDQVVIAQGPGAPGPLAGGGLVPAIAAFGALAAMRVRRHKIGAGPRARFMAALPRFPAGLAAPQVTVTFA
ncbi:hypothetical protein [Sphingomonas sp.]|jgi:hypothetical protein|uniref:hypothetical protein n=1 Tax=Sphingomonas sp. TaxID=28214 RepID=UPI002D800D93|nr:hypothetical protein [Sphingomonas sp.]HEU0043839.1 hypothetical protein [Sphingomonas sp.]